MPRTRPATDARSRRPRSSLTIEAILDAAEAVAQEGFDLLTIRAVANELEASPMGLYRYFSTKEELVDALLNRVLGRIVLQPEGSSWIQDLRLFAEHHHALLTRHPWAIAPLIRNPYPGPNVLPIGEHALSILARGGMKGDEAVAAFSAVIALNYGWSSFVLARSAMRSEGGNADGPALPPVPPAYPLTAEATEAMGRYGSDDHYNRALTQLIVGITAAAG